MIINEVQNKVAGIIRDGRNIAENFLQSLFKEPLIRVLLYLNEVWHIKHLIDFGKTHADIFAELDRFYVYQIAHSIHPYLRRFIF